MPIEELRARSNAYPSEFTDDPRERLILAAVSAWNGVEVLPDYAMWRQKFPLAWEAWGRVVDALSVTAAGKDGA